jgi:hypothetical protein
MPQAAVLTTIRIKPAIWRALRRLAEQRALEMGGRASASGVVSDLVRQASKAKREAPRA